MLKVKTFDPNWTFGDPHFFLCLNEIFFDDLFEEAILCWAGNCRRQGPWVQIQAAGVGRGQINEKSFQYFIKSWGIKPKILSAAFGPDWKLCSFKPDSIQNIIHKSNPRLGIHSLSENNHSVENTDSKHALFLNIFHIYCLSLSSF